MGIGWNYKHRIPYRLSQFPIKGVENYDNFISLLKVGAEGSLKQIMEQTQETSQFRLEDLNQEMRELLEQYEVKTKPQKPKKKRVTLTQVDAKVDKILNMLSAWGAEGQNEYK